MNDLSVVDRQKIKNKLEQNGYCVIDFLSNEELEELISATSKYYFQQTENKEILKYSSSFFDFDAETKRRFFNDMVNFFQSRLNKILISYDILMANFWEKKPGDSEVIVHQNWTHVDETKHRSYSIWIPLQETNSINGTMQVIPESHKLFTIKRGLNIDHFLKPINQFLKDEFLLPVNLKIGQAIIIDDAIIHYTGPNQSNKNRLAIQLIVKPIGASPLFYFKHKYATNNEIEVFDADTDFYINLQLKAGNTLRPAFGKSIGFINQELPIISITDFRKMIKKSDAPTIQYPIIKKALHKIRTIFNQKP
jgi:ectoine hydroxylase-related dioxygenase (phytanoyl-CoA dioxygenase family)